MKLFDLSHPASKARSGFKIWKRTACVMLAGSLLLSLTACGGRVAKTVTRTVYQEKEVQTVAPGRARVAHCFHITQADCTIRPD